ncbi:selenide, water dikinase SelD [Oryzobacter telluris]|uniref:selenide, water dikinase SelD n=1 Tax=Oryzobacter telluris TaxID=3149179 RepID=UPI00370D6C27
MTQHARGGGCACKVPPGELEALLAGIDLPGHPDLLVGADTGDDAAVVRIDADRAVISTTDFFTPVVDDPYDWGRIAAANALSDVWAMGGEPVLAVNLVGWPREVLPMDLLADVLRGGADIAREAGCAVAGGHTVDSAEPFYGMAVTGFAHPDRLLRKDAAEPGLPLTLTKPLGIGVLNTRHMRTGEVFPHAVAAMTTLNRPAARAAVAGGAKAATDVTGFGLLGHLRSMLRASGVGARLDARAVPLLDGAREAVREGFVSGGTRRNLDWVRPHLDLADDLTEDDLLLLADAQTSGGLLVVGEVPGGVVIGETVAGGPRIRVTSDKAARPTLYPSVT